MLGKFHRPGSGRIQDNTSFRVPCQSRGLGLCGLWAVQMDCVSSAKSAVVFAWDVYQSYRGVKEAERDAEDLHVGPLLRTLDSQEVKGKLQQHPSDAVKAALADVRTAARILQRRASEIRDKPE